jgi:hypothetical protein
VRVAAIVDPANVDPAYDTRRQKTTVLAPPLDPAILAKVGFGNGSTRCIGGYLRRVGLVLGVRLPGGPAEGFPNTFKDAKGI